MNLPSPHFLIRIFCLTLAALIAVSAADAALINQPTTILESDTCCTTELHTPLWGDFSTNNATTERTAAFSFFMESTMLAGEQMQLRFWGGVPNATPSALTFEFRVLFDSKTTSGAPSELIETTGLHTYQPIPNVQRVGTHDVLHAPTNEVQIYGEFLAFITLDQDILAGEQYWIEIAEADSQTQGLDGRFRLLPSQELGGNFASRRLSDEPVQWINFGGAPALQLTPVPEPGMFCLLGLAGCFSLFRIRK